MENYFHEFFSNYLVYFVGGGSVLLLLLCNDKTRKLVGKIFSILLILLLLAVAYKVTVQGVNQDQGSSSSFRKNSDQGKERKSIYYRDPEEDMRQSGGGDD